MLAPPVGVPAAVAEPSAQALPLGYVPVGLPLIKPGASKRLTQPKFTGTITLRYLRGTPLGPLRAEAYIDRIEGVKTFARGYLSDAEGATVEADGVFIRPAWARDAG